MVEDVTTGVDALIQLVKDEDRIPLSAAAKKLGISEDTVQIWVDFLVEEKILGIEYKLTTPIIYYIGRASSKDQKFESSKRIKEDFMKSLPKKMPEQEKEKEWRKYALELLEDTKDYFKKQVHLRNMSEIQDYAWRVFVANFLQ